MVGDEKSSLGTGTKKRESGKLSARKKKRLRWPEERKTYRKDMKRENGGKSFTEGVGIKKKRSKFVEGYFEVEKKKSNFR